MAKDFSFQMQGTTYMITLFYFTLMGASFCAVLSVISLTILFARAENEWFDEQMQEIATREYTVRK